MGLPKQKKWGTFFNFRKSTIVKKVELGLDFFLASSIHTIIKTK